MQTKETASNRVMVKEQDVESDKEIDKVCKKSRLKLYVSLIDFALWLYADKRRGR